MLLSDLKFDSLLEAKLHYLEEKFNSATEDGIPFFVSSENKEVTFQANEKAINRMSSSILGMNLAGNMETIYWTARDNKNYLLTFDELKSLYLLAGQHFVKCHYTKCKVRQDLFIDNSLDIEVKWNEYWAI